MVDRKLDTIEQLASELITSSEQFEPFVPIRNRNLVETLSILNGLEKITEQSLKVQKAQEKSKMTAPATPKTPRVSTIATEREEYKPAFKDPSLLEALLSFRKHHKQSIRDSEQKPKTEPSAPDLKQPTPELFPDFISTHDTLPKVDVAPKLPPLSPRSAPGATPNVLRSY